MTIKEAAIYIAQTLLRVRNEWGRANEAMITNTVSEVLTLLEGNVDHTLLNEIRNEIICRQD